MLKIDKITKKYKEGAGNFDISLEIQDGEVYGIMGPNGSGKSTFIRQILGFVKPDSGSILIDGQNPFVSTKNLMQYSGYIPGENALYDGLTGFEYLKIVNKLKQNVDWQFVEKLLDFFSLDSKKKIKKMSKGMKQKVAIIAAVMHKPKFLVLDEPTSGLDIAAAELFKDLILRFKNEFNSTIIICSHIFDEISKVCDKVGFIKDGYLIKEYDVKKTSLQEIHNEFINIFKHHKAKELF